MSGYSADSDLRWPLDFDGSRRSSSVDEVATVAADDRRARPTPAATLTPQSLCDRYAARVFKFAQLISDDSAGAEDLAQDALERAIRGLRTYDPARGDVEAWLWRIVVNASRDAGRIARRQQLIFQQLVDRWPRAEVGQEVGDLTAGALLSAVRSLSPRHRALIALRFGADMTHREVGKALGISEAAALMSTRRALAILRRRLSQGVDRHD